MKKLLKILGITIGVLSVAGISAYFVWFYNPQEYTLQLDPTEVYVQTKLDSLAENEQRLTLMKSKADSLFYGHHFGKAILLYEDIHQDYPAEYLFFQNLTKAYANLGYFDVAIKRAKELYLPMYKENGDKLAKAGYHCRMALFETLKQNYKLSAAHADSQFIYTDPGNIVPGSPTCAFRFQALGGELDKAQTNIMLVLNEVSGIVKPIFLPWAVYISRQNGKEELAGQLLAQASAVRQQVESGQMDAALEENEVAEQEVHFWLAQVKALEGDTKGAIESLKQAYENGHRWYYRVKYEYKIFSVLEGETEFEELMEQIHDDILIMRERLPEISK